KKDGPPEFKKGAKPAAVLHFGNRERGSVAVERVWGDDRMLVLVPEVLLDQARKGPLAYLGKAVPGFNPPPAFSASADVTKVGRVRDGRTYQVTREKGRGPWKLVKPANLKGREASTTVIEDVLNELNRLRAVEIVTEKADAAELATKYGLKSPSQRVAV